MMREFNTPNNEYKIRIYKEEKIFNMSSYGKYNCYIQFLDVITNRILVSLCLTEMDFLNLFHELSIFCNSIYNFEVNDTIIQFNTINPAYFIYLVVDEVKSQSPSEEEEYDNIYYFDLFESSIHGNTSRIGYYCSLYFLEYIFADAVFDTIKDIPYIINMNESYIEERYKAMLY